MSLLERNRTNELDYIYKIINVLFNKTFTYEELSKFDIRDIYFTFFQVNLFINNIIGKKLKNLNQENQIEHKGSIFDELDEQEGYTEILETNIYEDSINSLNSILRFAIKQCNNSLKETLEMDLLSLLDYIKFEIDYLEEHKDDEKGYDE